MTVTTWNGWIINISSSSMKSVLQNYFSLTVENNVRGVYFLHIYDETRKSGTEEITIKRKKLREL